MRKLRSSTIALIILTCLALFMGLISLSFYYYPGGNNFDPTAARHEFWKNFWCDVMAPTTLNDIINPGRIYALTGASFLILALLIMGINSSRFIPVSKQRFTLMMALGIFSIVMAVGVNYQHDLFLSLTAVSGLAAALVFLVSALQSPHKIFALLGVLTLFTGSLNFILWLYEHQTVFLPVIQKISTIFLILWLICGSLILMRKTI